MYVEEVDTLASFLGVTGRRVMPSTCMRMRVIIALELSTDDTSTLHV